MAEARRLNFKVALVGTKDLQNTPTFESKLIRDQRKLLALRDALLRLVEKTRAKKEGEDFRQLLHETSRRLSHNNSVEFP